MKSAEWKPPVSRAIEFVTNEANKVNHVMQEKLHNKAKEGYID